MCRRLVVGMMLSMLGAATMPLAAQRRDVVSLDVTLGPNLGRGGRRNYVNETAAGGEITLGFRRHPDQSLSPIGALTVGGRASLDFGDSCWIDPTSTTFSCRPHYPDMAHIGVLGGLEYRQTSHASLRALVGPALYTGAASGWGGQVQVDASAGFSHVAVVVSARGNMLMRYSGETMRFGSLGFGLRVQ